MSRPFLSLGVFSVGQFRNQFSAVCGYNSTMMDQDKEQAPEQAVEQTEEQAQELATPRNRGWFRAGDGRINRAGRPRGKKVSAAESPPVGLARQSDRLMRIFVEGDVVTCWLTWMSSPCLVNLPSDFRVVECQVDAARGGIVLTIRSSTFPRVAQGTPIPVMRPDYHGLKFCKRIVNRVGLVK